MVSDLVIMKTPIHGTFSIDKRSGEDRRAKSGLNVRSLLSGGRRENIRRQEDTRRIFYADYYSPGLFIVIVSILFLSAIDALLTLVLLDLGAYEISPVMAYFLKFGPYTFFTSKYLLTVIPVICLFMFRNIVLRIVRISTGSVLYIMALFYLVVVVVQIYFFISVPCSPDHELTPKLLADKQIICRLHLP